MYLKYDHNFDERSWPVSQAGPPVRKPSTPAPEVSVMEETEERIDTPWRVILYNDEVHTFDEVIMQIIKATGCSTQRAEELAWEVHSQGKAAVYEGSFEECFRVQGVLREIQLVTEIEG
jgi:ATP-dependent Clp protease adaptor protein ClpS